MSIRSQENVDEKNPTLADVARHAGVAVGTASRVLNNFPEVTPDSRRRVLEAVAYLDYRPLRRRPPTVNESGREDIPGNIGLIYLNTNGSSSPPSMLSEVVEGVESAVSELEGNLLLAHLSPTDRVPAFLEDSQVEGLIIQTPWAGKLPDPEEHPMLKKILRLPIVWLWDKPIDLPGDLCSFNSRTAARIVGRHFSDFGHNRVAFLDPVYGRSSLDSLKHEFVQACGALGLEATVIEPNGSRAGGDPVDQLAPLVEDWMNQPVSERPTAIFVPTDSVAGLVYALLNERSINVGEDVSLVSCNHERAVVNALDPTPTTVETHARDIARKSVEQLIWRIRNPINHTTQTILFEPYLIPGESVARLESKDSRVADLMPSLP